MIIYPAIDLKDGKCVRLTQGDFDKQTVFSDDPVKVAENFKAAGADHIHIVDLDAARTGVSSNIDIIRKIVDRTGIFVQAGGGIRTLSDVEDRLNMGVSRVIIGTAAIKTPEMVRAAVRKYGDKIAVGIDAKDGFAAISGWEEQSKVSAIKLCLGMKRLGVETIVYTDIATDGMMAGSNIPALTAMISESGLDVISSGGISSLDDLQKVKETGAAGAIIGLALYKGAISIQDIMAANL